MSAADSTGLVTDTDVAAFDEHGVTVLRGVFTGWVEALRAGLDANMANPGWRERTYRPGPTSPVFPDLPVRPGEPSDDAAFPVIHPRTVALGDG